MYVAISHRYCMVLSSIYLLVLGRARGILQRLTPALQMSQHVLNIPNCRVVAFMPSKGKLTVDYDEQCIEECWQLSGGVYRVKR